mgnify:FL=1
MEPVLQNTVSTGTDTAAGVIQVGTPPDIERISPLEPRVRPIVFPTRVSHDMKVRTSSLLLKVFQSVRERAPVVVLLARLRLMEVPAA